MPPIIERRETCVGTRFHLKTSGVRAMLDSRLNPQGKWNLESAVLEEAAKDLEVPVEELVERIKSLKEGETIEW